MVWSEHQGPSLRWGRSGWLKASMAVEVQPLMRVGPGAGPGQLDRGEKRKWGVRRGEETNKVHTLLGLPGLVQGLLLTVCHGESKTPA